MSRSHSGPTLSEQVKALGEKVVDFTEVDCLPPEIQKLITYPHTFSDPRVLEYTTSISKIADILHDDPASDRMLQIVYYLCANGLLIPGTLDWFLATSLSGQALRDRLKTCSDWLASHFVRPNRRVIDLGGGSGSYAFEALRSGSPVPAGFVWDVLDRDLEALKVAQVRARDTGLEKVVHVRQGNFMSESSILADKADYAVLIGVLCGMDKATAIAVLKRIKAHLRPGAEMLAATLLQKAFDEDPCTFRILCCVGGWQLMPKTPEQVIEIFEAAGWKVIATMSERPGTEFGGGQYAIVHARAV